MTRHDVAVIGAGPAGLTAATALVKRHGLKVTVLERESVAGGIPRHSDHLGYGMRDLRTFLSGPRYARRLVDGAIAAGAEILTDTMVTGWAGDRRLEITSPRGRHLLAARAVVLATGARERPRSARLIPGDRPSGVYTTGQLQNAVYLQHRSIGRRAVVVGAELVSYSAVLTLRHAGCRTALMTSAFDSPESYGLFRLAGRTPLLDVEVATRTRVARIIGKPALEAVELENLDTGARTIVECDTLVLTGDWVPDHELARSAGLDIDANTSGPLVDTALRTSSPGIFAIGNLVHPVDTADIAALDGRHVAQHVRDYLKGHTPAVGGVRILAQDPLRWISPGILRPADPAPARHRLLAWSNVLINRPTVTAHQDGCQIGSRRLPWPAAPGRAFRIPSAILDDLDPAGGDITVTVRKANVAQ